MNKQGVQDIEKWALKDWSEILITRIFRSEVANRKVTRIPSSSRFLGEITGLESETAEKIFICSFGNTITIIIFSFTFYFDF